MAEAAAETTGVTGTESAEAASASVSNTGLVKPAWLDAGDDTLPDENMPEGDKEIAEDDGEEDAEEDAIAKDDSNAETPKEKREQDSEGSQGKEKEEPETESAPEKPPKGYVPHGAFHEERAKARMLKQQVDTLNGEIAELRTQLEGNQAEPFKLLGDEEFQTMLFDNPDAVPQYLKQKDEYMQRQAEQEQQKVQNQQRAEEYRMAAEVARSRIDELLGDENAEQQAIKAMQEKGFGEHLWYLFNPETMVVDSNGVVVPMAEHAADLLSFFMQKEQPQEITLESVPDDVKKQIIENAQAEIVKKVKAEPARETVRKVSDIGSSGREKSGKHNKPYSQMTEAERAEYLMG